MFIPSNHTICKIYMIISVSTYTIALSGAKPPAGKPLTLNLYRSPFFDISLWIACRRSDAICKIFEYISRKHAILQCSIAVGRIAYWTIESSSDLVRLFGDSYHVAIVTPQYWDRPGSDISATIAQSRGGPSTLNTDSAKVGLAGYIITHYADICQSL